MSWLKRNASWLKWILAVVILGLLVRQNWESLGKLNSRTINWSLFGAALLIRFVSLCVTYSRWWLLVTGIGIPLKWMNAFRLGMFCEACNIVGPGAAGGDLVKAVWLAKDNPERRGSAAATVVLDRILGLWALFLSGALASLLPTAVSLNSQMEWAVGLLWLGTAGGLIGIILMLIPAFTHSRLMHWITTWPRLGHIVKDVMNSLSFYQRRRSVLFVAASLSLLGHLGFLTSFYLGAAALHHGRPFPGYVDHLVGLPLPEAVAAIPLTPGGVGILEWAIGYMYEQHQLSVNPHSTPEELTEANANGVLTALASRMTALILGAFGVIFYFAGKREMADAMQSQPETIPIAS